MLKILRKMMTVGVFASLMVTNGARDAKAFGIPLLSYDIPRVAENVKKISTMVQEVKAEVDSHREIVKQIQQGGYGAAAGMLFEKVENGDYDRLFGSFSDLGTEWKVNKEMSGKRAEMKAKCEKEAAELAQKANQEATEQCKSEQPVGSLELQKCIDSAGNAAKKAGKASKKECLKKGYEELSKELTKVRAKMYEEAAARYAEAKSKKKAYNWLQNAGLSKTAFMADDTAKAIADGRIDDAFSNGASVLGNSGTSFGFMSEKNAKTLGVVADAVGGVTQDAKDGNGIWGKMGIGDSNGSGGSGSSKVLNLFDILGTDESSGDYEEDADANNNASKSSNDGTSQSGDKTANSGENNNTSQTPDNSVAPSGTTGN